MNRHELRKEVFRTVFMHEFHDADDIQGVVDLLMVGRDDDSEEDISLAKATVEDRAYITEKSNAIIAKIPEYDEIINSKVEGWKTTRMAKVDLTLLRLALYELQVEELPLGVVINEAVSIADEYGTESSASFVNGALVRLTK